MSDRGVSRQVLQADIRIPLQSCTIERMLKFTQCCPQGKVLDSYAITAARQHRVCHTRVPAGRSLHLSEKDLQWLPECSPCPPSTTMHTMRSGILLLKGVQRAPCTRGRCSSQPGLLGVARFGRMQVQYRHHRCPTHVSGGCCHAAPGNRNQAARQVLCMQRQITLLLLPGQIAACMLGQPSDVTLL